MSVTSRRHRSPSGGSSAARRVGGRIAIGGVLTETVTVPMPLTLGDWTWSAPVSFCEPWPFDFHVLGQEGFLRYFHVLFVVSEHRFELRADLGPPVP